VPLETPTLAVVDDADLTGVTATITTSNAGATNTIYRSSVNGEVEAGTWTSSGDRTGDGTISVSLTTRGYYFWYVKSVLLTESTISNLVYCPVTDGADAVLTRCIDAVVSRLQLLTLSGISSANIVAVADIYNPGTVPDYPCVLVARAPQPHLYGGPLNNLDDITYPIQILNCVSDPRGGQAASSTWDLWQQQQERAFINQRLPGPSEAQLACDIVPAIMADPQRMPQVYDKLVSGFTLMVATRQVRGLGA
jgi:hypothetical protein